MRSSDDNADLKARLLLLALLFGGTAANNCGTEKQISITVTDKETWVTSHVDKDGHVTWEKKRLVHTANESFHNNNVLFLWKWNAEKIDRQLQVGGTYEVVVSGGRFLFTRRHIREIVPYAANSNDVEARPSPKMDW